MTNGTGAAQIGEAETRASPYAWYMLSILVCVYMLNFIDRQILSILAEDIKRDLKIDDSDLGFLYGTAFGVFYSLFGIPLGRLADNWNRVRLMTIGLSLWSAMTAFSGLSRSFPQLSIARYGVGVGEATASPCAYSLISDYFPKGQRATALAIYSAGLYLGGGISLFIGGSVKDGWNVAFPDGGPLGLVGWQAAFMAVGIPGLLLALVVATLREPMRGASDGLVTPLPERPFHSFAEEMLAVIPPLTLIGAWRRGTAALLQNLGAAALIAVAGYAMYRITGDGKQWVAVGLGIYAVFSWANALKARDLPTFTLIWGTPAFLCIVLGYGLIAFTSYAVSFWSAPYLMRDLGANAAHAGFWLGSVGALGGAIGVIAGGLIADHLRKTNPSGRVAVILFGAIAPIPLNVLSFTWATEPWFYLIHLPMGAMASGALGASAATCLDLVLPRMRGTATAAFFIGTTLIGLAMGPYIAGKVSVLSGDLATGMLSLLAFAPISITSLIIAYRIVPKAAATVVERARAAGEPV
jgi:MFS family permease